MVIDLLPEGMDVALVELCEAGRAMVRARGPTLQGVLEASEGAALRGWLASRGGWCASSGRAARGRCGPFRRAGVDYWIEDALSVPGVTAAGDSGSPWVDQAGALVALTVGVLGARTVLQPAEPALKRLAARA